MRLTAAQARAKRLQAQQGGPTPCTRPGCTAWGLPFYCSRRCASLDLWRKLPGNYYEELGKRGGRAPRKKSGANAIRPSELHLMVAGRFQEAARAIYARAYGAGWTAGRVGHQQRKAS